MAPADDPNDLKTDELTAIIREVRERVRARYPDGSADGAPIDLMPLMHARDAAEAKVAAIGMVNPRPGGPVNWLIQSVKKLIARALTWHVREQIEFNRNVMACVEATLESLNELNRAVVDLKDFHTHLNEWRIEWERDLKDFHTHWSEWRLEWERDIKDLHTHWNEWRVEWERKLAVNETQFLRSVADLQGAFQHRSTLIESNFREIVRSQHADFTGALERSSLEIQKTLWADMERIRLDYDRLIHSELRLIRQRAEFQGSPSHQSPPQRPADKIPPQPTQLQFDYARFAERFRGSEEYVLKRQKFYLPYFARHREVLDIGCGRGEFLELMREAGVPARGIDLSQESVKLCRHKGFNAEAEDLFSYLAALPESSLDGIFCAQVVEHLPPDRLPEMLRLASARLERGGVLVIETPNPECLAIFAVHFYLDPTHMRPIPHPLLAFHMEESGLGKIEKHTLSPAVESMPGLASLPEDFRNAFFGGLDYAIIGYKL